MLNTALCDILGIDVPIILAPMGTCTSAEFAAAVSNEGGLGVGGEGARAPLRQTRGHAKSSSRNVRHEEEPITSKFRCELRFETIAVNAKRL
jgi:NAD(P)H-dependent flavin oxidoreductase YrpB (nitropropane dioxygenase family)